MTEIEKAMRHVADARRQLAAMAKVLEQVMVRLEYAERRLSEEQVARDAGGAS